jgi:2-C-methyl-D-erythritol 4-phosphate cytidylyltransferase
VAVTGADSRSASVAAALARVETEVVVVHDGARPLATPALFDAVVAALAADEGADGAVAAAPATDTLKRATGDPAVVEETVDRTGLWAVQTPQAFRAGALRRALGVDDSVLAAATDDAMLVERAGGRIVIEPAPPSNLKVTTAADLRVAEALLRGAR